MSGKKIGSIFIMMTPVILFGSKIDSDSTAIPKSVGRAVVCYESELIAPISPKEKQIRKLKQELETLKQELTDVKDSHKSKLANVEEERKKTLEVSIVKHAERLYAAGVFDTHDAATAYATAYAAADYCP